MKYTISQLLEDKNLRQKLSEEKFYLTDTTHIFDGLDFIGASMRQNHRTAFDIVCAQGGDELLGIILKEGKTCLADNPNAAKVGVCPINGTENYFLKANANSVTALTSILYAIDALIRFSDAIDEEDIYFSDNPEEAISEKLPAAKNCSVILKNDKFALYDEDSKEIISFSVDGLEVEQMYSCTSLTTQRFEGEVVLGYKYQLEEDGKFGFISSCFAQFTPPLFEGITVLGDPDEERIIAWERHPYSEISIYLSDFCNVDSGDTDMHLPSFDSDSPYVLARLRDTYVPTDDSSLASMVTNKGTYILYTTSHTPDAYGILLLAGDNKFSSNMWYVSYDDGFITAQNGLDFRKCVSVAGLHLLSCICAVSDSKTDFNAVKCLSLDSPDWFEGTYIIEKEGYYAIVNLQAASTIEINKFITPFAFTSITPLRSGFALVEAFGKKGVFDYKNQKYTVALDYEEISCDEDCFTVERMGFTGKISPDGKWTEHLHRR